MDRHNASVELTLQQDHSIRQVNNSAPCDGGEDDKAADEGKEISRLFSGEELFWELSEETEQALDDQFSQFESATPASTHDLSHSSTDECNR